jgi:exopolyphosphatase/guanosine-5'-triphosphate,3'-diphosphate pyrophosphatase
LDGLDGGIVARYEYRVWGKHLTEVVRRLIELAERGEVRQSEETYLSLPSTAVNPKIRAGLLDVKVLIDTVDGFERWEPRLKLTLPVTADVLEGSLFPVLGLPAPALDREQFTLREFLDEVVMPHPELIAVEVVKLRVSYRLSGCLAEVSDIVVTGRGMQTVAVESEDLAALRAAVDQIGLREYENRSYPTIIRETLGLTAA